MAFNEVKTQTYQKTANTFIETRPANDKDTMQRGVGA